MYTPDSGAYKRSIVQYPDARIDQRCQYGADILVCSGGTERPDGCRIA